MAGVSASIGPELDPSASVAWCSVPGTLLCQRSFTSCLGLLSRVVGRLRSDWSLECVISRLAKSAAQSFCFGFSFPIF